MLQLVPRTATVYVVGPHSILLPYPAQQACNVTDLLVSTILSYHVSQLRTAHPSTHYGPLFAPKIPAQMWELIARVVLRTACKQVRYLPSLSYVTPQRGERMNNRTSCLLLLLPIGSLLNCAFVACKVVVEPPRSGWRWSGEWLVVVR